jgi:uncharacterized protein (TIGR02117 family)
MFWLKRLGQIIAWGVLGLGVATAVFFLVATLLGRVPLNQPYQPSAEANIPIYVLSNGVHTDLLVPLQHEVWDWTTVIPLGEFEQVEDTAVAYLGFGWGEQRLYREVPEWSDLTAEIAISAMMWPTPSAMHVYLLPSAPPTSSRIVQLWIDETQYRALIEHILASFSVDEAGQLINLNCCWYPGFNDNFYASPHWYHFLNTCNAWTNAALKAADLPTGGWALFDTDIMRHLGDGE